MSEPRDDGWLEDADRVSERLLQAGLDRPAAAEKTSLWAQAAGLLPASPARLAFFVPGRVEVLGKHTDYAGGRTMVFATQRGLILVALPREDRHIRVAAVDVGETVAFEFDPELVPRRGHWANYPMTVARRLARNFPGPLRGADIALASDLPSAAGMSSSSALVIGIFLVLAEVNRLSDRPEYQANLHDPTDLAGYLGTIENGHSFGSLEGDRGVGTFGGSEDHTAILCGRPNQISQYSYCPVRFEQAIDVPQAYTFAIAASGVAAEKTGAAMARYNAASARASALLALWREATGREDRYLAEAIHSGPEAAATLASLAAASRRDDFDADSLRRRLAHFQAESDEIIPAAADALACGDLTSFSQQAARSQELAERLLGNQVPQTSALSALARECGAVAACGFGAGFGGSVWALVERDRAESFLDQWRRRYEAAYPEQAAAAAFFTTPAGPGAMRILNDAPGVV